MEVDVVIDVGCATHGTEESVNRLISMFHPKTLYGFDPHCRDTVDDVDGTLVILTRAAAWTYDGNVWFGDDASRSRVTGAKGDRTVRCVDLAQLISEYRQQHPNVVLKLDAEGAEYTLLPHLISTGTDRLLQEVWVEWHSPTDARERLEQELACEVKAWTW